MVGEESGQNKVFCQKCHGRRECEVTGRSEDDDGTVRLSAICPACCSPHERIVSYIGPYASGATSILAHRLKIYVAGPFSADNREGELSNVEKAIKAGIELQRHRHHPYIPHLTYYLEQAGLDLPHSGWLEFDRPWLMSCDAILILDSSPGADQELKWAEDEGLVVYLDLESVPTADEIARTGTFHREEGV